MGPVSWLATYRLPACAFPPGGSGSLQALNVAYSCGAAADSHRTSRHPTKRLLDFVQDYKSWSYVVLHQTRANRAQHSRSGSDQELVSSGAQRRLPIQSFYRPRTLPPVAISVARLSSG
jgi:hypothetical protein